MSEYVRPHWVGDKYVAADGEILGEVSQGGMYDPTSWIARVGFRVKSYVSREAAQKAVERWT